MNAIINKDSIGLYINGSIRTVKSDHPYFEKIKNAIKADDVNLIEKLIDKTQAIIEFGRGHVKIDNGVVLFNGKPLYTCLTQRLLSLMSEGYGVENLVNFIENVYQNPSESSRRELYMFLEHRALPITEDGCFLAYKAVGNDFKDLWSGKVDNTVGSAIEMDRELVDPNSSNHCSVGYHVGAMEYVKDYGSINHKPIDTVGNRIMIVKVNPRDAVSVPNDHDCQKLRVCKYEVISELKNYDIALEKAVYSSEAEEVIPSDPSEYSFEELREENDDRDYHEAYRCGQLDAMSDLSYVVPEGRSKKYIRGYKNGFKKINSSHTKRSQ